MLGGFANACRRCFDNTPFVFVSIVLSTGSVVLYPIVKPIAMKATHNHIKRLTYPYPPHLIPEGKVVHKRV